MSALRWIFTCFSIISVIALNPDLKKRFLDLMNAFLIFLFCLIRIWMVSGMVVFGLMVFFRRWLRVFVIVSVRMLAALLIMLMVSGLSEVIRLEIWRFALKE